MPGCWVHLHDTTAKMRKEIAKTVVHCLKLNTNLFGVDDIVTCTIIICIRYKDTYYDVMSLHLYAYGICIP